MLLIEKHLRRFKKKNFLKKQCSLCNRIYYSSRTSGNNSKTLHLCTITFEKTVDFTFSF